MDVGAPRHAVREVRVHERVRSRRVQPQRGIAGRRRVVQVVYLPVEGDGAATDVEIQTIARQRVHVQRAAALLDEGLVLRHIEDAHVDGMAIRHLHRLVAGIHLDVAQHERTGLVAPRPLALEVGMYGLALLGGQLARVDDDLGDAHAAEAETAILRERADGRALRQVERHHGDLAVVVGSERVRAPDAVDVRLVVQMAFRASVAAHEQVLPLVAMKMVGACRAKDERIFVRVVLRVLPDDEDFARLRRLGEHERGGRANRLPQGGVVGTLPRRSDVLVRAEIDERDAVGGRDLAQPWPLAVITATAYRPRVGRGRHGTALRVMPGGHVPSAVLLHRVEGVGTRGVETHVDARRHRKVRRRTVVVKGDRAVVEAHADARLRLREGIDGLDPREADACRAGGAGSALVEQAAAHEALDNRRAGPRNEQRRVGTIKCG